MDCQSCDVVVIGAGISGLFAARILHKKDPTLKIIVLEAKDRVGGRTQTIQLKTGRDSLDSWDIGGQWVGSCQPHIMAVIEDLGLITYKQFTNGIKLMQLGSHKVRSYKSEIPSLSPLGLIDLAMFMLKVERMRKTVDVFEPFEGPEAKKWDGMTLETFLHQMLWTKECIESIITTSRVMLGCEPSQISLLFFMMYVSAANGIHPLVGAEENTAQELKVKGGTQQISEKMVQDLEEGVVLLDHAVSNIIQLADHVDVTTASNKLFRCRRVIFAIPPSQLGKINFDPVLPFSKLNMIKRMPMGHLNKIIVTYKHAFWRTAGLSGQAVINGGPSTVDECSAGPLSIIMDATSADGNPALIAFIASNQAVEWASQSDDKRQTAVLQCLAGLFGVDAYSFADYVEKDWSQEPYIMGAPVGIAAPGTMESFSKGLREPFKKLHFAGTESATEWCGYMSGAVQAGHRAAMEVLYHLSPTKVTREDMAGTVYDHKKHQRVIFKGRQSWCLTIVKYSAVVVIVFGSLYVTKMFGIRMRISNSMFKKFQ